MKKILFLLIMLFVIAACNNTPTKEQTDTESQEATVPEAGDIQIAIIDVTGMSCEACEKTIATALSELEGVQAVKVSLEYEKAKLKFEPAVVSIDDLKNAITESGYGVGNVEIINMGEQGKGQPNK
ncbi:MAG: heavy metal-associated domain-containing protein [Bacteroidota bacterium]